MLPKCNPLYSPVAEESSSSASPTLRQNHARRQAILAGRALPEVTQAIIAAFLAFYRVELRLETSTPKPRSTS